MLVRTLQETENNANISEEIPLDNGIQITRLPGFDSSKKILIYIPGYKENVFYESIHLIVNAYLKRGDTNVIVLDWSGYSTRDYVTAMVTCVTEVPRVADVIKQMVDKGIPLENFHIMGHSLGAQCAGLQRGDAEFVHIIHTDRGLYGTARTCGDFDVFFNNNGYRFQTGCPCVLVPIIFTFREETAILKRMAKLHLEKDSWEQDTHVETFL
ncbi:hypothetical protein C0J52_03418 [Blattella germanica]|nr:hypothetical protein C0J52_03418 [Blattella germanica]